MAQGRDLRSSFEAQHSPAVAASASEWLAAGKAGADLRQGREVGLWSVARRIDRVSLHQQGAAGDLRRKSAKQVLFSCYSAVIQLLFSCYSAPIRIYSDLLGKAFPEPVLEQACPGYLGGVG